MSNNVFDFMALYQESAGRFLWLAIAYGALGVLCNLLPGNRLLKWLSGAVWVHALTCLLSLWANSGPGQVPWLSVFGFLSLITVMLHGLVTLTLGVNHAFQRWVFFGLAALVSFNHWGVSHHAFEVALPFRTPWVSAALFFYSLALSAYLIFALSLTGKKSLLWGLHVAFGALTLSLLARGVWYSQFRGSLFRGDPSESTMLLVWLLTASLLLLQEQRIGSVKSIRILSFFCGLLFFYTVVWIWPVSVYLS